MKIECRGNFSYEVLKFPLRIGHFDEVKMTVCESFVVVGIFILVLLKLSSRKCECKGRKKLRLTSGIYEVLRSETEQNLGEGRAEPRTVYPLLYAPTTERRRAQRGTKRSGVSSKNIFRPQLLDRLSSLIINLIFSYLKNERGVRGEFHFSKHLTYLLVILYFG